MEKFDTEILRIAAQVEDQRVSNLIMSLLMGYDRLNRRIDTLEEAICELCEDEG